ncbi:class I SAM-dependent DNA methyltransferase [Pseudonocardia sp.]|uniref:class I SAM-dependent DNA methyltransferase n=1 Tax=Pseudonocardia sp. TaxID=60912 RepID=UPI003D12E09F
MTEGRELRERLADFVRYRHEHLKGDEKGEAQIFNEHLFRAFGHAGVREAGATLEERLKKNNAKGTAFADLMWKPRCLVEMKKAGVDLTKAYRQAFDYWVQAVPDRPQYVVLCNFDEFWIYDFDRQLDEPMDRLKIDDLPQRWEALSFLLPEAPPPVFGNDLVAVTRDAAAKVAKVFRGLHERGVNRDDAQRFVLQSVMAMFAEDIGLLPSHFFTQVLADSKTGSEAYDLVFGLFREMNSPSITSGGRYKGTPYFNGGLFEKVAPFDLTELELNSLREAAVTDWSAVRPEIFGTLFEQSMDAGERHAQGAHYTSQADIARVVIPTIVAPWRERLRAAGNIEEIERLLGEMYSFRVLDPACGSGNFLYVAYREMRRLESEAQQMIDDRRRSGERKAQRRLAYIAPDHFYGIDVNPFAVEVAKVTMMLAKKLSADELDDDQDVLPLDNLDGTIVAADALFSPWPKADAIIGNPPFLGRRKMVEELGVVYNDRLRTKYPNIGGVADFVTYWFPLAHDHLKDGGRAGFVGTKSIRETSSRIASLDYVVDNGGTITEAVSSQPWSGDAVVHVSIVNWIKGSANKENKKVLWLNGTDLRLELDEIPPSLKPGIDVRKAVALSVNQTPKVCFQGQTPGLTRGFTVSPDEYQSIIKKSPESAKFLHPYLTGDALLRGSAVDRYIIDLPHNDALAAETAAPFLVKRLKEGVLPKRLAGAEKEAQRNAELRAANPKAKLARHHSNFLDSWWQLAYRREDMLDRLAELPRYIVTSRVSSFERPSVFAFVGPEVHASDALIALALADNYSFGVVHSQLHRKWFEARCSGMKADPRYTSTTVFDSYPWPQSPKPGQVARIEKTVQSILDLRNEYLAAGVGLAKQYDVLRQPGRSTLRTLHQALDAEVTDAYGFNAEEDLLTQLYALNLDLAEDPVNARGPGPVVPQEVGEVTS